MKFRPLHDRVVVKRIEADDKTAGGIIIPDTAKEKPQQGEVIAVGPGGRDESGKLIPIDVKAGDTVLFGKWSGTEVKIDGVEYPDHEGERHHGRDGRDRRRARRPPDSQTTYKNLKDIEQWQLRKLNSPSTRATRCCAAWTFSPTR